MTKIGNLWKTMLAGGAGVAALAAMNASIRRNASEPDDSALGGEARFFDWKYGRIFYKTAGSRLPGAPLVFIHGVGAGSSSFMWRKNFDVLARDFRVYAFDLLGFGLSDKPATAAYSADLYVDLITDFIREVSGYPANIVASSLGAAYAIRVADEHPELVKSMVLNAPTGADKLQTRPGMAGAAFYGLLQSPVLGTSFYNVMASERGIRDYSRKQLFYDHRRVTNRLVTLCDQPPAGCAARDRCFPFRLPQYRHARRVRTPVPGSDSRLGKAGHDNASQHSPDAAADKPACPSGSV
ncbi:MAG: alpha/beta fold hydrolase [Acidobacteriota bacterium]